MITLRKAAAAAALALLPAVAWGFQAFNTLQVVQTGGASFEVIGRPGVIKDDYWCAAGDYTRRALGRPWNTRIFVVSGIGRSVTTGARSAVRFTLDPGADGVQPYEGSWVGDVLTPGYARSATRAFGYCDRKLMMRF